VNNV
jgi:hypothetical protein